MVRLWVDGEHSGTPIGFRWTQAGGMQSLGSDTTMYALSANGAVLVEDNSGQVRWTQADGLESLGSLSGSGGYLYEVSADGTVITGETDLSNGNVRFSFDASGWYAKFRHLRW